MKEVSVYRDPTVFAGWPANHGRWQWGNELLFGFMVGKYDQHGPMHQIKTPYHKVLARSMDGGETWRIHHPGITFSGQNPTPAPPFDLNDPNTIIRACGNYDTGGEDCPHQGAFYLSTDRGYTWSGPYEFTGLDAYVRTADLWNTSRTCVIGNRVFLSAASHRKWATDHVFEAQHNGKIFLPIGMVLKDKHRAVMPSVAMIGDTTYVAMRRKGKGLNWISIARSQGRGWDLLNPFPAIETGGHNGNPPALVARDGSLFLAYANRTERQVKLIRSDNQGENWSFIAVLSEGNQSDIGYPQMWVRPDGKLVVVFYVSDNGEPQHIRCMIV
jgi:hypothetical protein